MPPDKSPKIEAAIAHVLTNWKITLPIGLLFALYASITFPDGVVRLLNPANDNVSTGGPSGEDPEDPDDDKKNDDDRYDDLYNPKWAPPR